MTIPVADDCPRREFDQGEDGLRRAAFHPEESNRLKYIQASHGVSRRPRDLMVWLESVRIEGRVLPDYCHM
ncbi:MAG: hypothetical protein ACODAD_12575 [Planctomycetota bacterium]